MKWFLRNQIIIITLTITTIIMMTNSINHFNDQTPNTISNPPVFRVFVIIIEKATILQIITITEKVMIIVT